MIERAAAYAGGATPEIDLLSEELSSARSAQRVDEVLEMATARLGQDQLITPSNNNARYYYELALSNDPDNTSARQGLIIVAGRLVLQARTAIDAGQFVNAEDLLRNARSMDPSSAELAAATTSLEQARAARAQAEQQARDEALRLEAERSAAIQAEEERRRTAAAVAAAAAAAAISTDAGDTAGAGERSADTQAETAAETIPEENADPDALESQETMGEAAGNAADAGAVGAAATLAALNPTVPSADDAVAQPPPGIETVPMSELSRIKYVAPKYPRSAQRRNVTGTVDLAFTVSANGQVIDLEVLESTPGSTFDEAAMEAVSMWLFEPTVVRGQPVERRTAIRLAFNLQ